VLNVYIGMPNRVKKLGLKGSYSLDKLRYMIVDCRLNPKGLSIFETRETRIDTLDLITMCDDILHEGKALSAEPKQSVKFLLV